MTTVAYDGISLCADTLIAHGTSKHGHLQKAFAFEGGALAYTGDCIPGMEVIAWLLAGSKKKDKPELSAEDDFDLVWVKNNGRVMCTDHTLRWIPGVTPYASGSGADFALAAMSLGKSAKQAVELACELDVYSGGPVTVIRLID